MRLGSVAPGMAMQPTSAEGSTENQKSCGNLSKKISAAFFDVPEFIKRTAKYAKDAKGVFEIMWYKRRHNCI